MFSLFEISRKSARPVELYLFHIEDSLTFYSYTSAERTVSFATDDGTFDFAPLPISRDSFTVSGTLDRQDLNLEVPHDSDIPELVRLVPPTKSVSLTIYQGHINDPDLDFLAIWSGRVTAVSRKATTATITCQAIFTSLRRQGLRRNWQYGCPNVLYGPVCRANKAARSYPAAVIAPFTGIGVERNIGGVVFPAAVLPDLTVMGGGTLEFTSADGDSMALTIQAATEVGGQTQIFLVRPPPPSLIAGTATQLVAGCDHTMVGCNKHVSTEFLDSGLTNIRNYGGQPWIPTKNPVGQYNAFY